MSIWTRAVEDEDPPVLASLPSDWLADVSDNVNLSMPPSTAPTHSSSRVLATSNFDHSLYDGHAATSARNIGIVAISLPEARESASTSKTNIDRRGPSWSMTGMLSPNDLKARSSTAIVAPVDFMIDVVVEVTNGAATLSFRHHLRAWRKERIQRSFLNWKRKVSQTKSARESLKRQQDLQGEVALVRREVLTLEGSLQQSRQQLFAARTAQSIAEQSADMEKRKAEARFGELQQEQVWRHEADQRRKVAETNLAKNFSFENDQLKNENKRLKDELETELLKSQINQDRWLASASDSTRMYEARVAELELTLSQEINLKNKFISKCSDMENEICQWRLKVDELERSLAVVEMDLSAAETSSAKWEEEYNAVQERHKQHLHCELDGGNLIQSLKSECESVNAKLIDAREQYRRLVISTDLERSVLLNRLETDQAEYAEEKLQLIKTHRMEMTNLSSEVARLELDKASFEPTVAELSKYKAQLSKVSEELVDSKNHLEESEDDWSERLESSKAFNLKLQQSIDHLGSDNAELLFQLEGSVKSNQVLEKKMIDLQELQLNTNFELNKYKAQLSKVSEELLTVKNHLEESEDDWSKRLEESKTITAALKETNQNLFLQVTTLQTEVDMAAKSKQQLERLVLDQQQKIDTSEKLATVQSGPGGKSDVAALVKQVTTANSLASVLEAQLAELEAENNDLENRVLKSERLCKEQERSKLQVEQQLPKEVRALQIQNMKLTQQLSQVNRQLHHKESVSPTKETSDISQARQRFIRTGKVISAAVCHLPTRNKSTSGTNPLTPTSSSISNTEAVSTKENTTAGHHLLPRLQALVRRRLVRKKISGIVPLLADVGVDQSRGSIAALTRRRAVIFDFLKSEKEYVEGLDHLVEGFLSVLVTQSMLPAADTGGLDSNGPDGVIQKFCHSAERLVFWHHRFYKDLVQVVERDGPLAQLGPALSRMLLAISAYSIYIAHLREFRRFIAALACQQTDIRNLLSFEVHNSEDDGIIDFPTYLLLPLRRLPQYLNLIKRLEQVTNPKFSDYPILETVHLKIAGVLRSLTTTTHLAETRALMINIVCDENFAVVDPSTKDRSVDWANMASKVLLQEQRLKTLKGVLGNAAERKFFRNFLLSTNLSVFLDFWYDCEMISHCYSNNTDEDVLLMCERLVRKYGLDNDSSFQEALRQCVAERSGRTSLLSVNNIFRNVTVPRLSDVVVAPMSLHAVLGNATLTAIAFQLSEGTEGIRDGHLFEEAQSQVYSHLKLEIFPLFQESQLYRDLVVTARQGQLVKAPEVSDHSDSACTFQGMKESGGVSHDHRHLSLIPKTPLERFQARVRGFLYRRSIKHLVGLAMDSDTGKRLAKRNNLIREVVESERRYVQTLKGLVSHFLQPLYPYATEDSTRTVCETAEQMLFWHSRFSRELDDIMQFWPTIRLGGAFLRMVQTTSSYSQYVVNYMKAKFVFSNLADENENVANIIKRELEIGAQGALDFPAFLSTPYQRLPRYVMMLKGLVKYTAVEHADYRKLNSALDVFLNMSQFVNECDKQSAIFERLSKQMKGFPTGLLDRNVRWLVKQMNMKALRGASRKGDFNEESITVYIFTDKLVVAKRTGNDQIVTFDYAQGLGQLKITVRDSVVLLRDVNGDVCDTLILSSSEDSDQFVSAIDKAPTISPFIIPQAPVDLPKPQNVQSAKPLSLNPTGSTSGLKSIDVESFLDDLLKEPLQPSPSLIATARPRESEDWGGRARQRR